MELIKNSNKVIKNYIKNILGTAKLYFYVLRFEFKDIKEILRKNEYRQSLIY